ncbi:hypothetical protein [Roseateles asaccharophilus]|uniref:Uncharacterized protein n=1 Tax=Roseateles asaccharophilus TaxID=582607 RepID=A0ABU2AEI8_9BURK|nr:hypothetical protein [Roseateles asaccharophilus]MDR7335515.1 hypothetical protein [Roseateles asaccharophilus]
MNLRKSEYLENELSARWLDPDRAKNAYSYALQFSSKDRYGLSEATVGAIEHVNIESYSVADAWLKDRLPAEGTVQVVYGDDEVCVIFASDFLAKWQSIFVPARDDAIVLHNLGKGVLFYCHEEELEFGHRKA